MYSCRVKVFGLKDSTLGAEAPTLGAEAIGSFFEEPAKSPRVLMK